jgi:hypothetical protein
MLPSALLMKDPRVNLSETLSKTLHDNIWDPDEIELWKKWKYFDGVTLEKNLKFPRRQSRAGMPYGVSSFYNL